jgi:hypothetical protein
MRSGKSVEGGRGRRNRRPNLCHFGLATASNLPFSEWGQVIGDLRLVDAIVHRFTFNAHIIEAGSESFRLRSTKAKRGAKTPK